ncbi:TIGR04283 family arsenosugar biosynthesis glycosyltransferase [Anaerohalosphaera lusitana]|uniref:TIGR04283 family arsenosugar biosynthesis glycosyltransferase n=1 Tax=Anaerohalosphaera lusitana TaxID=1936003 RepID=UPI001F017F72|nr:TIGR04283 family arsenosugar biosynthesis glycosyltransferase [Anaerohalosphaera lusitana]
MIIPVLHESAVINETVQHVFSIDGSEDCEVIVADGSDNADTLGVIKDGRITKMQSSPGRAIQMNAGANAACGNVLVFLHADTFLPKNAFTVIKNAISKQQYAVGAFKLGLDSDKLTMKIITALANLRNRILRIPYGDQAIFIRRELFEELGGFPAIPLMEDIELMKRLKRKGCKVFFSKAKVTSSARRWQKEGPWRCSARNLIISAMYHLGVPAERLVRFYRS